MAIMLRLDIFKFRVIFGGFTVLPEFCKFHNLPEHGGIPLRSTSFSSLDASRE